MSEKMFSREQYEQLRSFPEISRDELFRYFTLTPADVAFVDPGAGRGPGDRLGMAVQLATLPWLGFVPDDVASAPPAAVARLAERRRRLAEPDLEFRAFCARKGLPASSTLQLQRAWDAWQAERYQRGGTGQRPGYTGNPFRPP